MSLVLHAVVVAYALGLTCLGLLALLLAVDRWCRRPLEPTRSSRRPSSARARRPMEAQVPIVIAMEPDLETALVADGAIARRPSAASSIRAQESIVLAGD